MIKKNEKKIKELEKTQKELNELNKQLDSQIAKLGVEKKKYSENALSADEEIAILNKQIAYYKNKGCGENDTISVCSRPKVAAYAPSSYTYSGAVNSKGFQLPLSYGYITSYYGNRIHPIFGNASHHDGIDIAASTGTPVVAANKGEIIHAGSLWGFGYTVMIYHSSCDCTTLYGHLNSISVSEGLSVRRGQQIGTVGSTGNSTGPHLHFQAMYGSGYNFSGIFDPMNLVYIPLSW